MTREERQHAAVALLQMLIRKQLCHQWTCVRFGPPRPPHRLPSHLRFRLAELEHLRPALPQRSSERRIERLNDRLQSIEFPVTRSRTEPNFARSSGGASAAAIFPQRFLAVEEIGQMQAVPPKRFAVEPSISVNPLRCSRFGMPPSSRSYSTCDCAKYAISAGPPT